MPCYTIPMPNGDVAFLRGNLGPHCVEQSCGRPSEILCDYPVGRGKTCDRKLCPDHAHHVGGDLDYCEVHWQEYVAFSREQGRDPTETPHPQEPDCSTICDRCGAIAPGFTATLRTEHHPTCCGELKLFSLTAQRKPSARTRRLKLLAPEAGTTEENKG